MSWSWAAGAIPPPKPTAAWWRAGQGTLPERRRRRSLFISCLLRFSPRVRSSQQAPLAALPSPVSLKKKKSQFLTGHSPHSQWMQPSSSRTRLISATLCGFICPHEGGASCAGGGHPTAPDVAMSLFRTSSCITCPSSPGFDMLGFSSPGRNDAFKTSQPAPSSGTAQRGNATAGFALGFRRCCVSMLGFPWVLKIIFFIFFLYKGCPEPG